MRAYVNGNLYGFNEEDVIIIMLDGKVTVSLPDDHSKDQVDAAMGMFMRAIADEEKGGRDD